MTTTSSRVEWILAFNRYNNCGNETFRVKDKRIKARGGGAVDREAAWCEARDLWFDSGERRVRFLP